jgi:hypothetical protein
MPNSFAYLMIIIWPLVSVMLYKRKDTLTATFFTIVGGYLILPVRTEIDFPLIPALNKESVSALSALIGCIYIKKVKIDLIPKEGVERWLILIFLLLPILTVITNTEPVFDGKFWRPELTFRDAIGGMFLNWVKIIAFILGLQLIKKYDQQLLLFKYFTIAGLWYSLPILLEIRLSPQLHTWIYGFFPHFFNQQMRGDGFRAVVFLGHGLLVAIFVVIALASATTLWKQRINTFRIPAFLTVLYLLMVLILSKTLGANFLALILIPAIVWLPSSMHNNISRSLMLVIILYPLLTMFKIFPQQEILEFVSSINPDRAGSLFYRFQMETRILEHTTNKFLFGWGAWDRNLPWGTVPDGYWIVLLSSQGFTAFIAVFGLALTATIKGVKASNELVEKAEKQLLTINILLIVVIMIDQIPNSSMNSIYIWFLLGALIGRSNYILKNKDCSD